MSMEWAREYVKGSIRCGRSKSLLVCVSAIFRNLMAHPGVTAGVETYSTDVSIIRLVHGEKREPSLIETVSPAACGK